MTKKEAYDLADKFLGSEFEAFSHNPVDYCKSIGWLKNSNETKKALQKQDTLKYTDKDIKHLAEIIEGIGSETSIEIFENSKISDFLCNCVAEHILK